MNNTLAFGKKAFTIAVVGSTILWAVGSAALMPLAASAASAGDLIKGSLPAVYYYGADGKRYVFPNEKTYKTWYSDFSGVKTISDTELAAIAIGGNATYRATAGASLAVKIQTSPTVYIVGNGGELRAIPDEATAKSLLGDDWNKKIHDVPDAFFTNYKVGTALAAGAKLADLGAAAANIGADKGLAAGAATPAPVAAGAVSLSLAADTPASASAPINAGEVIFTKVAFAGTGKVKSVKVIRSGLSADADLSSVKLFDGATQLGTNQTFDANHQATFVLTTLWDVSGGKTLTIAADIAAAATGGNSVVLGISAATDVTLESGTVGGTYPIKGNAMTMSAAAILGALSPAAGSTQPSANTTIDAGNTAPVVLLSAALSETTGREDVEVTRFSVLKAGTHIASDVSALELYDLTNAKILASVTGWNADSRAVFDLSAAPLKLLKGASAVTLEVRIPVGKVVAGAGRTLGARLEKSGNTFTGISARGTAYNLGIVPSNAGFDGTANTVAVNAGSITVLKSASTPATGNVSPGDSNVKLATWDFVVKGEDLRSTSTIFTFADATGVEMATANVTNCTLRDKNGTAVAGPVNPTAAGAALVAEDTITFSTTVTYPVGSNAFSLHCNLSTSVALNEVIQAGIVPNATNLTLTGVSTGNAVAAASINSGSAAAVNGNTLTARTAALTITNLGTPPQTTVVQGAQAVHVATVNLSAASASSGEDVRVTSITITDTTSATADGDDVVNISLKDKDGKLLSDVKQSTGSNAADADPTYAFSLTTPLVVTRASDVAVYVYVDVRATLTGVAGQTHTFSVSAVGNLVGAGATTGSTLTAAQKGTNPVGAGQALTLQTAGTLTETLDSASPSAGIVVAGKTGVTVSVFRFVATREDAQFRTINIVRTNGSDADIAKLYLYDGDTKLAEAVLSNGSAAFDISAKNFTVSRLGTPRKLTVKADFNTQVAGATSGNSPRFDLDGMLSTAVGAPLGLASGNPIALDSVDGTAAADDVTGNAHSIRKTAPTFVKNAANTTTLVPGTVDFLLDISADAGADVVFRAVTNDDNLQNDEDYLRFAITELAGVDNNAAANDHYLVRKRDNAVVATVSDYDVDATFIVFAFDTEFRVPAGGSETLVVRLNLGGGGTAYATGNTFQLQLAADTVNRSPYNNGTADLTLPQAATVDTVTTVSWFDDSLAGNEYNGFGLTSLPISHAFVKP